MKKIIQIKHDESIIIRTMKFPQVVHKITSEMVMSFSPLHHVMLSEESLDLAGLIYSRWTSSPL